MVKMNEVLKKAQELKEEYEGGKKYNENFCNNNVLIKAKELLKEVINKGCGKKMRYSRIRESYECGDVVQTNWGTGFEARCVDCRNAYKILQEILE